MANADYRDYLADLHERGIEIALHGVSSGNNTRERVIEGFKTFGEAFGDRSRVYICHGRNKENPYWGHNMVPSRVLGWGIRLLYIRQEFSGHEPGAAFYWSDICWARVDYIRKFRTLRLNVLRSNPSMPYYAPWHPEVRYWFSATAQDRRAFRAITTASLDRLAREDGLALLYIHSANAVQANGGVQSDARGALELIGKRKDVWRSNVSSLLDRCLAHKNLVVTRRRNGIVITNASRVDLTGVQLKTRHRKLYGADGRVWERHEGVIVLPCLNAWNATCLYYHPHLASVADSVGISKIEEYRMAIEEVIHVIWQILFRRKE